MFLAVSLAAVLLSTASAAPPAVELKALLEAGEELSQSPLAQTSLTRQDAKEVREVLRAAHADRIRRERAAELESLVLREGETEMRFTLREFGKPPETGSSLWISLHGGGQAPAAVNDQQWRNQQQLYTLEEGLYVVPRAPTNTWNLWHEPHIDRLLARLIETLSVLRNVDTNRVYLLGYSAGGDGVYQLAPRLADRWAAAAMMAGHPNDASPLGLRNVPFALQVGGRDTAYRRNEVAMEWGRQLDSLQQADPGGYAHFVKVYPEHGHWMNREDRVCLPWMARFRRTAVPRRVVWKQSSVLHDRLYWLAVPSGTARAGAELEASVDGQTVSLRGSGLGARLLLRLDDRLLDLDQPVRVQFDGTTVFEGDVSRSAGVLARTLQETGDPELMFDAQIEFPVPGVAKVVLPPVTATALSADRKHLVVGSQRGLELRNWPSLTLAGQISSRLQHIHDLKFSPDGTLLLAAGGIPGESGTVEVVRWADRQRLAATDGHTDLVYRVQWSPDGQRWATASLDGTCQTFSMRHEPLSRFTGHSRGVLGMDWVAADLLVSTGADAAVKIWQAADGTSVRTLDHHTGTVTGVLTRPGQRPGPTMVATFSDDRTVRFWQPTIGRLMRFVRLPAVPTAAVWSPEGKRLAVGDREGKIHLLDPETARIVSVQDAGHGRIQEFCLDSATGQVLVAAEGGLSVQSPFEITAEESTPDGRQ